MLFHSSIINQINMTILFLIEVTFPWKPVQWKHVLTFKGISRGNAKLKQVVINLVLFCFDFSENVKASSMSLASQQCLLVCVQQITFKITDYTGLYIYIQSFIFAWRRLYLFHAKLWVCELLLCESPRSTMFSEKGIFSILNCNYFFKCLELGPFQPPDQR